MDGYSRLRLVFRVMALLPVFLIGLPVQVLALKFRPDFARSLPVPFHRLICRILGIRRQVIGPLPPQGPMLVVSNHVSWLDIVVLSTVMPVSFVAKSEVAGWPGVRSLARAQRTIFVERGNRRASGASAGIMAARLREGDAIVLFAEGTTSDGNRILPYRSALLGAAGYADVLVLPVAIAYRGHAGLPMTRRDKPEVAWYGDMDLLPHLKTVLSGPPVDVEIHLGAPMRLTDPADRKRIGQEAEHFARAGLEAARRRDINRAI